MKEIIILDIGGKNYRVNRTYGHYTKDRTIQYANLEPMHNCPGCNEPMFDLEYCWECGYEEPIDEI
jgi:hypothetical protein